MTLDIGSAVGQDKATSSQMVLNVLTVKQPWASLIVAGVKDVENRTWRTPYRGILGIHSAKTVDAAALADPYIKSLIESLGCGMPTGAILGIVRLDNIIKTSSSKWAISGNLHWLLSGAQRFQRPIECRGELQIWQKTLAI